MDYVCHALRQRFLSCKEQSIAKFLLFIIHYVRDYYSYSYVFYNVFIAKFFSQTSAKEPREPVLAQVRHIGLPTKGDNTMSGIIILNPVSHVSLPPQGEV